MNHNGVVRDNRLLGKNLFSFIPQSADAEDADDTQAFRLVADTNTNSANKRDYSVRSAARA